MGLGGSQFIRAGLHELLKGRGVTSSGDSEIWGRVPSGSGVGELRESSGRRLGRWCPAVWFLPGRS